ncbi:Xaa-Pro peptidase family protein [Shinella daejeonensis]|uniref:M24 family metallopeptidase n=1 Tax=Shinella daejeonensis TaxID=659017 RepID=UPI0020C7D281|nr:Xaa-Pro peptidase family protein [Shinella daejeonensis]MCP8897116.1 Xaa-Pro peptidase family protein [Shinella daejeonensis]
MQVWTLRNPARYVFVATEGPVVMFEFAGCNHLLVGLDCIDEIRPATSWFYFTSGPRMADKAKSWAAEMADLVRLHGGGNKRLAADRLLPAGFQALTALGIDVVDGQAIAERARCRKSVDEIQCMVNAIAVCQTGVGALEAALRPGVTENELWSVLHAANIALGGEYIETRLLSSGDRTNPWYQETSERPVEAGDLVALDTDLIGPYGYFADMSRTFLCGDGRASGQQRTAYRMSYEQIHHNMSLLRPGVSFKELSEKSWKMPEEYVKNRYMSLFHGAGLGGEYPYIPYWQDYPTKGYDGLIEENMLLCVESFIGSEHGGKGVKLEQLVRITENGAVPLSSYPFDERLLGREF